jgi:hypothetical protein
MDDIELLVSETYRHFQEKQIDVKDEIDFSFGHAVVDQDEFTQYPLGPGIIYHIQKSGLSFVIRTFISKSIRQDFSKMQENPENFPSLRLLDCTDHLLRELKYFSVDDLALAEIIHGQLHNRRFPVHEELMCNLSDPGFSWWLTKKDKGFSLSFTLSIMSDHESNFKLGPLGDKEVALYHFQLLGQLIASAGIEMNIQNEVNRVQFTDCEPFILEELKDLFEFGVFTETFKNLFKLLFKKSKDHTSLEQVWFYLNELSVMRRFWIQIQFDLQNEISTH